MNPFRSPGARPLEVEVEPDPFPTRPCVDCGAPTTSMNGEACCARCDLRNLSSGFNVLRKDIDPSDWFRSMLLWSSDVTRWR